MTGKVIWVDEDERIWEPERRLLTGLGFDVEPIGDATSALDYFHGLENEADIKIVICDVMLLRGGGHQFSEGATAGGLNTGIVLAKELLDLLPVLQGKLILFSRVTGEAHIGHIRRQANLLNIRYLQKSQKTQGRHFLRWLHSNGLIPPPG